MNAGNFVTGAAAALRVIEGYYDAKAAKGSYDTAKSWYDWKNKKIQSMIDHDKKLTKQHQAKMAKARKSKSRSVSRGRASTITRAGSARGSSTRVPSTVSTSSYKSLASTVRGMKAEKPIAQIATTVRHKKVKASFKGKAKKKVKVSKPLRAKIEKVLEAKKVYGMARVLIFNGAAVPWGASHQEQAVFPLPIPRATNTQAGVLFNRKFLMYLASRLFNGRPADDGVAQASGGLALGDWRCIDVESSPATATFPWSNFSKSIQTNPSALKFEVSNLKAKIMMKNNSTRTIYLVMYECKPKYQFKDEQGSADGLPAADWDRSLTWDFQAVVKGGDVSQFANPFKASGINVPSIQTNATTTRSVVYKNMYATPKQAKNWNTRWAYNEYKIVLEPGQVHTHWVQGDTGEYDFSKFYTTQPDGTVEFNNVAKTDRHIFFTCVPEMAYTTTGSGRYRGEARSQLLFETEIFASISMPEPTGLSFTVANALPTNNETRQLPLNFRKRAYLVDNYYDNLTSTVVSANVDDNAPTLQTTG